jgi:hypothetical protein
MKINLFLIFSFLFHFFGFGQLNENDFIIPINCKDTIFNCQILEINGNTVIFNQHGQKKKIIAFAVNQAGELISLTKMELGYFPIPNDLNRDSLSQFSYQGQDYVYYYQRASRAKKLRNLGRALALSCGAVSLIRAYPVYNYTRYTPSIEDELMGLVITTLWVGAFSASQVGFIIWVSNNTKYRNEIDALFQCNRNHTSLKVTPTKYGIGLVMTF